KQQELSVEFAPEQPRIHVDATYDMRNTGIRPLMHIAVRLPSQRFNVENVAITFDGKPGQLKSQQGNSRVFNVEFEKPWPISSDRTLKISYDIAQGASGTSALTYAADAFFLPGAGWSPQLPQPNGPFGFGGIPPKKWSLTVRVPKDFRVHMSGGGEKAKRQGN